MVKKEPREREREKCCLFGLVLRNDIATVLCSERRTEGTQPGFPFPNSGDPPGTPTDLKKKNLSFLLYK